MRKGICVALCTYNGERYLRQQLDSIAAQTRLPDALVLVDDGSRDASVAIGREFQRTAPFPVTVVVNERNLGYARNFEKAIGLADGEVIALSDQDDVWNPVKLERMEAAFASGRDIGLVFTDAALVDADLRPLGYRLWDTVDFTRTDEAEVPSGRLFARLLRGNVVTGATMAFRSRWRDLVLPVDPEGVHDAWIALLLSAVSGAVAIPEPLIQYRQHGGNQIGARKRSTVSRVLRARETGRAGLMELRSQHAKALERLSAYAGGCDAVEQLREAINHLDRRIGLREARLRRVAPICREILNGGYQRGANGLLSAVRDLIV